MKLLLFSLLCAFCIQGCSVMYASDKKHPIDEIRNETSIETEIQILNYTSFTDAEFQKLNIDHTPDTYFPRSSSDIDMGTSDTSAYYEEIADAPPIEPAFKVYENHMEEAIEAEKNEHYGSMIIHLEEAANTGNAEASYQLAKHYMKGEIVPKNMDMAESLLEIAHKNGHPEAMRVLAWRELQKSPGNPIEGDRLMELSAEISTRAKREYGMLLLGIYSPNLNNPEKGIRFLNEAYSNGDPESALLLYKIEKERGGSYQEYLEFAANSGSPEALAERGRQHLSNGEMELAYEDYENASLADDESSMFTHANNLLLNRYGTGADEMNAYIWFSILAKRGNDLAKKELTALAGVRKLTEHNSSDDIDFLIAKKEESIKKWNPNGKL